jgi:hypothetical protein
MAGQSGDGWVDGSSGNIGAGASQGGPTPGAGGGGGGSSTGCTYAQLDPTSSALADTMAKSGWADSPGGGAGAWYRKSCPDGSSTVVWLPTGGVDPAVLAQEARDRTNIPLPAIGLNPPAGSDQVVNLATWMWVRNWIAVSASASAGAVTATVTAQPVRVEWSMGNGDVVTCTGAGTPYDRSRSPADQHTSCSYEYRHSSASSPSGAFTVRATAVWHVTWVATGVNAGGDFGLVGRVSETTVRVAEIQAEHQ